MKIEEGKSYRARNGQKIGPMRRARAGEFEARWKWTTDEYATQLGGAWMDDGSYSSRESPLDLIAEWIDETTSPVRTRTVTEIVAGTYGRIQVEKFRGDTETRIRICSDTGTGPGEFWILSPAELRAAAAVFVQLADALEGQQ